MSNTPDHPGSRTARALQQAVDAHLKGDLAAAEAGYAAVLEESPEQFGALHMLGVIRNQQGLHEEAVELIGAALRQNDRSADAHYNLGISLAAMRQHGQAAEHFARAIALDPGHVNAHISIGNAQQALKQHDKAIASYQRALSLDPNLAAAHNNLGNALRSAGRVAESVAHYERALALKPDLADVHNNLGNALQTLKRPEDAIGHYEAAIRLNPRLVEAYSNLGNSLRALDRYEEAIASYHQAIAIRPSYAEAHYNLGGALTALNRHEGAIASLRTALSIDPDMVAAYTNLGGVLYKLGRYEDAIAQCRTAIEIDPGSAGAYDNLGNALTKLQRLDEALESYRRAIALDPGQANARSSAFELGRLTGDWGRSETDRRGLIDDLVTGRLAMPPFGIVTSVDDPELQLRAARAFVETEGLADRPVLAANTRYRHDRIRVAYLSADFREHATAFLAAELFERHDHRRFDVYAVSWGRDDGSALRKRLERSFDRFIDVRATGDLDVAREMRDLEIDIAVDLNGFFEGCRPGILARRPAPIQVNYLGYPATMGADYIDYVVVDPFVVPADQQAFFSERLVFLPDCYQPNDRLRAISERTPSRSECGLPEGGFVFACFNSPYKITPTVFDVWMRLLRSIPGAVLWLLRDNVWVEDNLRREAEARGVARERLVFGPRLPLPEHLARHRVADLFLDTFPCNAHTTASDALWAGLPLLTCAGRSFVARVAGSLLHAVGLPELVTNNPVDYESMALEFARSPERLAGLRDRLRANRGTSPLFDAARLARHLEAAYVEMRRLHESGIAARSFAVPPARA